ncbi:MAG: hypothetical protein GXO74_00110 [Calditrichaeota bacterium]|nr:hypothetical protein [Calditrichota bacterium]
MKRRAVCILLQVFLLVNFGFSQQSEYGGGGYDGYGLVDKIKPINLIDVPTANFLSLKNFQLKLRVYDLGGMLAGLTVGLTPRLMFGVTYGGQNIVGHGHIKWNEAPGVNVRYRVKFETERYPAVSIGFDSQGYGTYYSDLKRYQIKSMGFYAVASKNFTILKDLGLHGGINYSSENKGSERDMNFFIGSHLYVDRDLSLIWEYNFATNDNDSSSIGTGKGYMNIAVRWAFSRHLMLEFSVKNLLKNNKAVGKIEEIPNESRELKILYFENF